MKQKPLALAISAIVLVLLCPAVLAEEADDVEVFGVEFEKVLNLGSGLLATALFILTSLAYRRTKRGRLLYVSAAFLLFAVKGVLTSLELFFGEWPWADPAASFLDFGILLSFIVGVMKK